MRSVGLLVLITLGCAPPRSTLPPAPGATLHCADYDAKRWVADGLAMCAQKIPRGPELVTHGSPYYLRYHRGGWMPHGPIEGTRLGMRVRGWYLNDVRVGGWQFTDENGVVRAEGRFRGGHRDGTWTIRYATGNVASKVHWEYANREGDAWFGYRDGLPWWQGRYERNKPVGPWVHWDRAGRRTVIDSRKSIVGPFAEGFTETRDNAHDVRGDDECPYSSLAYLRLALEKRGDVVTTRGPAQRVLRSDGGLLEEGSPFSYARADGTTIGTVFIGTRESGEIVDENGEVFMRGTGDTQLECRDEGGRLIR